MAGIYLYAPTVPPPPPDPPPAWPGLASITWTGWDGTVWELKNPRASGVYLRSGVRGMGAPTHDRWSDTSAAVAGSRFRGARTQERVVFWPISVYNSASSAAWIEHDRAWWKTMDELRPGTWTVTQPDGSTRSLTCRFENDSEQAFDTDPSLVGWTQYGIYLVADEQPYWQGAPVSEQWNGDDGTGQDYESSPGDDFVLDISPNPSVEYATMTNIGDVDAYPVWTLTGPMSAASVGTYDTAGNPRQITISHALAANETLIIDPRPQEQTAIFSTTGENWARDPAKMTAADFNGSLIAAGETVSLATTITGEGSISATLVPLYRRAW